MKNNNKIKCSVLCCVGYLLLQLLGVPVLASYGEEDSAPARAQIASTFHADTTAQHAAAAGILPVLYEQSDYAPVWSNPLSVSQLLDAIRNSERDGLNPEDYNLATLQQLLDSSRKTGWNSHEHTARLDLLLSDSLVRLASHLAYGKVDSALLGAAAQDAEPPHDPQLIQRTIEYISSGRVDDWLQAVAPQSDDYRKLRDALARYRHYQSLGGWQPIPEGPTLKTGMVDERVPLLRARLIATGELTVRDMYFRTFDDSVAAAVASFQRRHGLDDDGVVGSKTLAALNEPVEKRIEQILANLERARYAPRIMPDSYIAVDIAGYRVEYIRDGTLAWQSRAVVGRPLRMSPALHSRVTYLELNPSWTVPPTVLEEDVLPELSGNAPDYLREHDMHVVDYQGNPVESDSIIWSRYSDKGFPWLLRQRPGPRNALGRIKFMFANPYSVYMHDTPSRGLFKRRERALSSGCIRIEEPLDLAQLLLEGTPGWDRAHLVDALDSLESRSVGLAQPVDIFLNYRTVSVADDGTVFFYNDIYQQDDEIIRALQDYQPDVLPALWQSAWLAQPASQD